MNQLKLKLLDENMKEGGTDLQRMVVLKIKREILRCLQ